MAQSLSGTSPSELRLTAIRKSYGATPAVRALDLVIAPGELVSLLGPSGCGKTTTLRMVAGFETPDAGRIEIGGQEVTALPPNRRGLGMVFQSYSLFPHRTVAQNIAFGLRMAGASKQRQAEEVARMLDLVQLAGRGDMFPAQLSGGQQQRVALARALVVNPRVLLLDEPLGALDKALREQMQFEIRAMQQRLGITTLLVTHDQEEAMSMSDRIAVMQGGRVLQMGAPSEIYDRPASRFVAQFLGSSNLFDGRVSADGLALESAAGRLPLPAPATPGQQASLSVRPERIAIGAAAEGRDTRATARLEAVVFRGSYAACRLLLAAGQGAEVLAHVPAEGPLGQAAITAQGQDVTIGWNAAEAVLLPAD